MGVDISYRFMAHMIFSVNKHSRQKEQQRQKKSRNNKKTKKTKIKKASSKNHEFFF